MDTLLSLSPDTLLFNEIKKKIGELDKNEYFYAETVDGTKTLAKKGIVAIFFIILIGILDLFCKVYAVYLCWNINSKESPILRILYTIFAYWFGIFYLIYYKIAH